MSATQLWTPLIIAAPLRVAVSSSTSTARPYPLWPAMGNCAPFSGNSLGSVVGTPSSSTSQVSGMLRPSFLAANILVAATALVAMSSMTVRSVPVGAA